RLRPRRALGRRPHRRPAGRRHGRLAGPAWPSAVDLRPPAPARARRDVARGDRPRPADRRPRARPRPADRRVVGPRRHHRHDPRPRRRRQRPRPLRRGPAPRRRPHPTRAPRPAAANRWRCLMSQVTQSLAALGGLALGGALLGGMLYWQSGLTPPATSDWRPPCISRLGPSYAAVAPTPVPGTRPARNILFGIDRSGSNSALADTQLDAAVAHAATLDPGSGTGILLITDRSDRSTTPDMPFEPGHPDHDFKRGELPCAPDCPP